MHTVPYWQGMPLGRCGDYCYFVKPTQHTASDNWHLLTQHALSKKRNATITATGSIFVSQYMNVLINQNNKQPLVNQKQPLENSIITKTSAMLATVDLKVPPVAGSLCMPWLWDKMHYPARRQGYFSEQRHHDDSNLIFVVNTVFVPFDEVYVGFFGKINWWTSWNVLWLVNTFAWLPESLALCTALWSI